MPYPCDLIRDLIPLVHDGVASEPSGKAVREHLAGCSECRKFSEQYRLPTRLESDTAVLEAPVIHGAQTYQKKVRSKFKKTLLIAVSIVAAAVFLFNTAIVVLLARLFVFNERYTTTDIADYGIYEGHITNEATEMLGRFSLLEVFPDEIGESWTVNRFYYRCQAGAFANDYWIVLDYTLPKPEFSREVERISDISVSDTGETNHIRYDGDSFRFPAYIAVFEPFEDPEEVTPSEYGAYEYALVDAGNCRIICILIYFDPSKLPVDDELKPPLSLQGSREGFSIYRFGDLYMPSRDFSYPG